VLGLGRERRGEPDGGVQVAEDRIERRLYRRREGAHAFRGFATLVHRFDDAMDLLLRRAHAGPDFFRRARALLGELAHFTGYHAEAEPVFAGAGGFDRRVERQEIGLARDARDAVHQFADLARLAVELAGYVRRVIHVHDQIHQERPGARDLFAALVRLHGDVADL